MVAALTTYQAIQNAKTKKQFAATTKNPKVSKQEVAEVASIIERINTMIRLAIDSCSRTATEYYSSHEKEALYSNNDLAAIVRKKLETLISEKVGVIMQDHFLDDFKKEVKKIIDGIMPKDGAVDEDTKHAFQTALLEKIEHLIGDAITPQVKASMSAALEISQYLYKELQSGDEKIDELRRLAVGKLIDNASARIREEVREAWWTYKASKKDTDVDIIEKLKDEISTIIDMHIKDKWEASMFGMPYPDKLINVSIYDVSALFNRLKIFSEAR